MSEAGGRGGQRGVKAERETAAELRARHQSVTDTPEQAVALDPEVRDLIGRLDRDLNDTRRHGERAGRQIHKVMVQDLRAAERRAREAEKRARRAERRADRLERELAAVRDSSTFRAGRAVMAVPVRIKKWRQS